jgi:hypothetical protein
VSATRDAQSTAHLARHTEGDPYPTEAERAFAARALRSIGHLTDLEFIDAVRAALGKGPLR